MTNKTVTVSVDRRLNAIVISPTIGVSLSRIESTLIGAGMSPTVVRSVRKVFLPLGELSNVQRALAKWDARTSP